MEITAKQLLEIAAAQVGYREKETNSQLDDPAANAGDGNWTKYARDLRAAGYYNGSKNGYAWCDVFVDWCFFMLCGKDPEKAQQMICQSGPLGAGCRYSAGYYRSAGRFYGEPAAGDQVFFGPSGRENHTGLVEAVSKNGITVIEGNSGDRVARRTYRLDDKTITGYGRPQFHGADLDAVAWAVIRGNWGNGTSRRARLTAAGYDPAAVQARVNELMKET